MNAGSQLIAALEGAWACIQERHPDLPDVVVITGEGAGGAKLGHFAANRWREADSGAKVHEMFVAGEQLAAGPMAVLQTLLHEGAHALATVRGIQDTSRQGRYHNARFVALAEELGLALDPEAPTHPTYGKAFVVWRPETLEAYDAEVKALGVAIRHHYASAAQQAEDADEEGGEEKKPRPRYECGCPRVIRMAAATYEEGGIMCQVCDEAFAPVVD